MIALNYLGYDPLKEVPIVTQIKADIKKFNDKNQVISRIKELEKEYYYELDKKQYIWLEKNDSRNKSTDISNKSPPRKATTAAKNPLMPTKSVELNPRKVAVVFKPTTLKELNRSHNSLDLDYSLEIINSYLVKNSKLQNRLETKAESARVNYEQSLEPIKFLKELVHEEEEAENTRDHDFSPDMMSSKSESENNEYDANQIETILEED